MRDMKPSPTVFRLLTLVFLLFTPLGSAFSTDTSVLVGSTSVTVTPDIIKAKLAEVEASTGLDEATKGTLTEQYRKALSSLENERASTQAAKDFSKARETAPAQAKAVRQALEKHKREFPTVTLEVSEKALLAELLHELINEEANRAAVDAKLAELDNQLATEAGRPAIIRKQITEYRSRRELVSNALKQVAHPGESPQLSEARQWSLQTKQRALRAELNMLDQELLSQPMRVDLLKIQQEKTERSLRRLNKKIDLLEELISRQRRIEAEQASTEAEAARIEMAGKHLLIRELAERNAALTDRFTALSAELERISSGDETADDAAKRIEEELRSTRKKLEVAGLSQVLGRVLLEQRRQLPDARSIRSQARERADLIAAAALDHIQDGEELKRLRNIGDYVEQLTAGLTANEAEQIQHDLTDLAKKRLDLLGKTASLNDSYLRALGELDFAEHRLIDAVETYDSFLAEHLLWIRNAPAPDIAMVLEIPVQIYDLLAPHHWLEIGRILYSRLTQSPILILVLIVFATLLASSRQMHAALEKTGKDIIKASTDRFRYTLQALGLTLLLASPWPLLAGVTGWQLSASIDASYFAKALSQALIVLSPAFFFLKAFRTMCLPSGLAQAHFRWPETSTKALRRQLRILMVTFLPAGLVAITAIQGGSGDLSHGLGRIAFVIVVVALSTFFYRLFGPNQTTLQEVLTRHPSSALARFRILWLVLALLLPVCLVVLALAGFLYTAIVLTASLVQTLWLVLGFIVIHQLAERWLLMTRRKLALEAAIERRRAAFEAEKAAQQTSETEDTESSESQVEEPEIDLFALNAASRKLLNTIVPLFALVGLWFIWSEVLPAFGLLDNITLWHYKGMVGGEEQLIPVTLANLLLAVIIFIVTVVASKRFPALLEIILLQRFSTTSGGRYAATTLSRYSIAAVGTLLALSTIGAKWSQVQWLVAALSVGIGFGLQEIVANFISGLIILFERPIRVGDVVTIGDTDGVVTRIQIRATTIRTWDRLELLVPNKEFVTGRLLNWSLSDQTTRIKIPVGIAYGSDVQKAKVLMNEAAEQNEAVLEDPKPSIIFEAFGDNSLNLVLRCFVDAQEDRMPTLTALHEAINHKFNDAGIVIAFPQRDVHLDTSRPLDVRIRGKEPAE